jgi:hypothetical protein
MPVSTVLLRPFRAVKIVLRELTDGEPLDEASIGRVAVPVVRHVAELRAGDLPDGATLNQPRIRRVHEAVATEVAAFTGIANAVTVLILLARVGKLVAVIVLQRDSIAVEIAGNHSQKSVRTTHALPVHDYPLREDSEDRVERG